MTLQEKLCSRLMENMGMTLDEADLVLNKPELVQHIKSVISEYIEDEQDVDRLSEILKFVTKKFVTRRNGRYVVSKSEVTEAIIKELSK